MVERRRKTDGKRFYGCAKFGKGGCGETVELKGNKLLLQAKALEQSL